MKIPQILSQMGAKVFALSLSLYLSLCSGIEHISNTTIRIDFLLKIYFHAICTDKIEIKHIVV